MKNLNKLFAATMVMGIGLAGFSSISHGETYDGLNSGEVEINGSIGKLESTNPDTNLPEGSDDWINISVDTATAFHTTIVSNHEDIESARYNITNHSGRGVAVYLDEKVGTPQYVRQLVINPDDSKKVLGTRPAPVKLISNGAFTVKSLSPWLILANKNGEIVKGSGRDLGNSIDFYFTGKSQNLPTDATTTATAENYKLTLKFAAIQADGTTIGR